MILQTSKNFSKILFVICCVVCFFPFMDAPLALCTGFFFTLIFGHPLKEFSGKMTKWILQFSVVGLGFGMNAAEALKAGREGLSLTVCSIFFTLALGFLLGKLFKIDRKISTLISAGTAICGGSAIAAISPVIAADEHETSVSLAAIFILNSVALIIFPILGHYFHMDAHRFGLWCAIAIHDTSSVVGAASKFGNVALQTATTVKLERALWIIPVSIGFFLTEKNKGKIKIPYFIFLFVAAIFLNSFVPQIHAISAPVVQISKKGMVLALFLIGSGLSISSLKQVGVKPLLQGILLWIAISVGSFLAVEMY